MTAAVAPCCCYFWTLKVSNIGADCIYSSTNRACRYRRVDSDESGHPMHVVVSVSGKASNSTNKRGEQNNLDCRQYLALTRVLDWNHFNTFLSNIDARNLLPSPTQIFCCPGAAVDPKKLLPLGFKRFFCYFVDMRSFPGMNNLPVWFNISTVYGNSFLT